MAEPPERSGVNFELERKRKRGHNQCEVRKSLIPNAGWGLFATTALKEEPKTIICSYEGVEVSREKLACDDTNRDYVQYAVKNHQSENKEFIYIDALSEVSCYGRYSNDPIDDHLVNAKILWRGDRLCLIPTKDICAGDEIFINYGADYWEFRLRLLDEQLRERIRENYVMEKGVRFDGEVEVVGYDTKMSTKKGVITQREGVHLRNPPMNRITRAKLHTVEDISEVREPDVDDEEFMFDNVKECEELAAELQFLNGRKFVDEGRLYEIYQVTFEEEYEMVIGFRKPLSGRPNKEDGSAFAVYGKEGLYALSEKYLLDNPEAQDHGIWPKDNEGWSDQQRADDDLSEIMEKIDEGGSEEIILGKDKYKLVATKN